MFAFNILNGFKGMSAFVINSKVNHAKCFNAFAKVFYDNRITYFSFILLFDSNFTGWSSRQDWDKTFIV